MQEALRRRPETHEKLTPLGFINEDVAETS